MTNQSSKFVAFIPARSGSVRIKDKNMSILAGQTLIARSVIQATRSNLFSDSFIITDSRDYELEALKYGASSPGLRPPAISSSTSSDLEWIQWFMKSAAYDPNKHKHFAILRPTSPFRSHKTLCNAVSLYKKHYKDGIFVSLRSLTKSTVHPGKLWIRHHDYAKSLLPFTENSLPWCDNQSSALPQVFVQNAALEISSFETISHTKSTSGFATIFFEMDSYESHDINIPIDLEFAEFLFSKIKR